MVSGWNLWVWLEYIGVVIIIITFPYSTCISSFFGSSIPISLFIFKMFFRSCNIYIAGATIFPVQQYTIATRNQIVI